jgi:endogenous inhibitor of DNA gyrase (YacG/DUF329 family)
MADVKHHCPMCNQVLTEQEFIDHIPDCALTYATRVWHPPTLKPEDMLHHCPLCNDTLDWKTFRAHAAACIGAHPEVISQDATIQAPPAEALARAPTDGDR